MFGNILGRKKEDISKEDKANSEIESKILKMNLTDMRAYVKNNMGDFESCEDGLISVMARLNTLNEETSKRYIELDDMDSKKKKGFDLVIVIAGHKKMTVTALEMIQKFIELYEDIIDKYDHDNKQIYKSKLNTALENAMKTIVAMNEVNEKAKVLGQ